MGIGSLRTLGLNYWKNPRVKQIIMLFSINIAGIPIAIVTNIILTHYLGPNAFGDYQFLDNLFTLTVLICSLGFFQAANRALVLNQNKEKAREYYGAALLVLGGLFVLMSVGLVLYSFFDPNLREKHLQKVLLYSIPLGWAYLGVNYFEVLFQADNRVSLLGLSRLLPKIIFFLAAITLFFLFSKTKTNHLGLAWGSYISTLAVIVTVILLKLRVSFRNLRSTVTEIWAYNKSYGIHVYIGSVFSVGVAGLTPVIISYFGANNSGVGFYALALALANPLQFIPNTIATTNYKEFATHTRIPKKLTQLTIVLTIASLVALWVIVPFFVKIFFGNKFIPVIYLNFIVSSGIAFYGLADYYNRFLGARGHGKLLRNTSFIVGSLILVFNFILIPIFGPEGAAFTRLLGGLTYLLCMLYYYKKTVKRAEMAMEETK